MKKIFILLLILSTNASFAGEKIVNNKAVENDSFIFVKGYHNEKIENYFKEHKSILKEWGYKKITTISPQSEQSITSNAEVLAEVLRKHKSGFAIIAHSKGGLEALVALLKYPELIQKVTKMILVQSPLKGSPFADAYWKKSDIDNFWVPGYLFYSRAHYAGFLSMRTEDVKKTYEDNLDNISEKELRSLGQKIYYWRSKKDNPPALYDDYAEALRDFSPHDGLVPTTHMMLKKMGAVSPFGQDLGVHNDTSHLEMVSIEGRKTELIKDLLRKTLF